MEGSYKDLMELLFFIEADVSDVKVSSVKMHLVKDKRRRNEKLHMEIIFQNVLKS